MTALLRSGNRVSMAAKRTAHREEPPMARAALPPTPDFAAMEAEASKGTNQQTAFLTLIGHFVFSWSNNESVFIYILMILLETDEPSAAIVFATLNTTRARLDLIQRLASVKIADPEVQDALDSLIKRFNLLTKMRNEFNHCTYELNARGEITRMHAMRIREGRGWVEFGSSREVDRERINEMQDAVGRLTELNRDLWNFLPRLRDSIARRQPAAQIA